MSSIVSFIITLIHTYKMILLARILLTWLPNINWHNQPFLLLRNLTDPVLEPFRRLLPAFAGIDFSPILLFFLLGLVQQALLAFS